MFVSRKYLALIHFVAREVPTGMDVSKPAHKGVECGTTTGARGVHLEPLSKSSVQGLTLRLGYIPGLFDQGLVCT